jgi:60 kDa SS-A/Ro ribonucleoprotein
MSVANYVQHVTTTRQTEKLPGTNQEANHAGGYAYVLDDWQRLTRFLILGAEGNTYYCSEREMTRASAAVVERCFQADPFRTVERIAAISAAGRAPTNDPALFALALCASYGCTKNGASAPCLTVGDMTKALATATDAARSYALAALPRVARTGTHLFTFVAYVNALRGWGRSLRTGVANWYLNRDPRDVAYQVLKYQSRNGWSHRDVLRLCHARTGFVGEDGRCPDFEDRRQALNSVLHWAVKGWPGVGEQPHPDEALRILWAFEKAKKAPTMEAVAKLIREYGLPREAVPTQWLNHAAVWEALLEKMPLTALVRNLATLTRVGLLTPLSDALKLVRARLGDAALIQKARVHPVQFLTALRTYAAGRGEKGKHVWTPLYQVVEALEKAFHLAFAAVEPTNQNWLLALDVSGSMASGQVGGVPNLTPREASAALALVTAAVEPHCHVVGFTGRGFQANPRPVRQGYWNGYLNQGSGVEPLNLHARMSLGQATTVVSNLPMGPTDCALPMVYAAEKKLPVDAFVIYTDNETWQGDIHASVALERYRQKLGRAAKLIVLGLTATQFTIGDPQDPGTLNVVGFDTAVPQLIADFVRGEEASA